ncbi:hypothetical protein LTR37_013619 [Vermiconidia calcicola]|uniref:Uncharacterized protein n=1 Tax=Vermiconidia calcicola TaxID=1690605 RepID=A0ACC3MX24_9PEZI|nr:hypothetical protein LTR37_013619 [Vermiconidia calcicola]
MLTRSVAKLSIATLTTTFVGAWAMSGGKKQPVNQGPPINAKDKDEEKFIQDFLQSADKEGGGAKQREGGH